MKTSGSLSAVVASLMPGELCCMVSSLDVTSPLSTCPRTNPEAQQGFVATSPARPFTTSQI